MRIIFLGDTHGRGIWKKILENEQYDLAIFGGDYVSTHEDITEGQQVQNLKEILEFKEENPDTVILLRGNHDLQHLGYSWAECSGEFREVKRWLSRKENAERFLNDTQWIYIYNNFLFSHAGISKTWLNSLNINNKVEDINLLPPSAKFAFTPMHYYDHYGDSITQPCVWIRPLSLMEDALDGYIQIVGHTPVTKITNTHTMEGTPHIWLCDALPFEYLVIEGQSVFPKYVDKPVILLKNRYSGQVYLEHLTDNQWVLKGDESSMKYLGISYLGDHIFSVDPSGGPYLHEGDSISGKKILSIREENNEYILTLEDENKDD